MKRQTVNGILIGVVALVAGVVIGSAMRPGTLQPGGGIGGIGIGVPEILVFIPIVLFIGFWVVLIGAAVWAVRRLTARGYAGRLEDLPADFDDWHRRAHERMRERGADDPDRRG